MEEQAITAVPLEGGDTSQSLQSMSELLDQGYGRVVPVRGETIEGTIVSASPSEVIIDIGCKSEGVVGSRDLEHLDPDFRRSLKVGGKVFAYVVRPEGRSGHPILSLSRAMLESDWQEAARIFEAAESVEEEVISANRGGIIVNVGRVRGFVPASQVCSVRLPQHSDETQRIEMLGSLTGQKLHLKIIELDRRRNRLILSERVAQREWRQGQKERLLDQLQEGEIRKGVVNSLCDFGAFVDLGGADGLVHLSELSWGRVGHPRDVLSVGQEVDVYVLGVDRDRRRIALSMKRLKPEPWSTVEERFQIGQLVSGTITKVTDFGAFARLDDDIEGLIHISELSEDRIEHPSEVVKEGQDVSLRVIRLDPERQRMGLSLRRVNDENFLENYDWQAAEQAETVDEEEDSSEE